MIRCTITKNQRQETVTSEDEDTASVIIGNNPLDDSRSCTSLTAAWVEVFVLSLILFVPALFGHLNFASEEIFFRLHGAIHYECYLTVASGFF